jgi:hypothetical protein
VFFLEGWKVGNFEFGEFFMNKAAGIGVRFLSGMANSLQAKRQSRAPIRH